MTFKEMEGILLVVDNVGEKGIIINENPLLFIDEFEKSMKLVEDRFSKSTTNSIYTKLTDALLSRFGDVILPLNMLSRTFSRKSTFLDVTSTYYGHAEIPRELAEFKKTVIPHLLNGTDMDAYYNIVDTILIFMNMLGEHSGSVLYENEFSYYIRDIHFSLIVDILKTIAKTEGIFTDEHIIEVFGSEMRALVYISIIKPSSVDEFIINHMADDNETYTEVRRELEYQLKQERSSLIDNMLVLVYSLVRSSIISYMAKVQDDGVTSNSTDMLIEIFHTILMYSTFLNSLPETPVLSIPDSNCPNYKFIKNSVEFSIPVNKKLTEEEVL